MASFESGVDREGIGERSADVRLAHVHFHVPGMKADHVFWRVARHLGIASVDLDELVVFAENGDTIAGILDQRSPPFGFVGQR